MQPLCRRAAVHCNHQQPPDRAQQARPLPHPRLRQASGRPPSGLSRLLPHAPHHPPRPRARLFRVRARHGGARAEQVRVAAAAVPADGAQAGRGHRHEDRLQLHQHPPQDGQDILVPAKCNACVG